MPEYTTRVFNATHVNYLFSDRYTFPATWVYPEALIPYSMLRLIEIGRGWFQINGEAFEVEPGQIIYIPKGCQLSCRALTEPFQFISVRFTIEIPVEDEDVWFTLFGLKRVTPCNEPQIEELFDKIVTERMSDHVGRIFRLRGYLELLLSHLLDLNLGDQPGLDLEDPLDQEIRMLKQRELEKARALEQRHFTSEIKSDSRVLEVIEFVIRNLNLPLELRDICRTFQLSESTLRRLFKHSTGKSPIEFIRELKMQTAAQMLLQTEERISAIAYELGFADPNYFCRTFRKNYGASPRDFRRLSRG